MGELEEEAVSQQGQGRLVGSLGSYARAVH